MNIGKRILALAAAGAASLLVGGVLHNAQTALAFQPTTVLVGCANTTDPTQINWTTSNVTGLITSLNQNTPVAPAAPASLSLATPLSTTLCGVVAQDAAAGGAPNDANPNTVDGGSFTATVPAGTPAQILESNTRSYSWNCGGPVAESCTGAIANAPVPPAVAGTLVSPAPGNTYHVSLVTGASFGLIGTATPVITTMATWTPSGAIAGQTPVASPPASIAIVEPTYSITLTASPSTIPAQIPTSTSAVGSVITATLYHLVTGTVCVPITGGSTTIACSTTGGTAIIAGAPLVFAPGAESGTVTFSTNLGLFSAVGATPAGPGATVITGAAQTVSVHCGAVPNTFPTTLLPTPGLLTTLTLNSCPSVTATLVGGGEAGTATVIANFVGDFTGATAFPPGEVTVNLTPGPITVPLTTGCNEVITPAALAAGSNGAAVAALATGFNVTSIWVFNNASHTFQALYFSTTGAPTDISSAGPGQSVFVCGTGSGTFRVA